MTDNPTIPQGLKSSISEEQQAQKAYHERESKAGDLGDKKTADLYSHISGEEKQHEAEFKLRLKEVVPGNPGGSKMTDDIEYQFHLKAKKSILMESDIGRVRIILWEDRGLTVIAPDKEGKRRVTTTEHADPAMVGAAEEFYAAQGFKIVKE